MRRIKILGLAMLALFAFGVVVASTAAAEEKEPAGLLFLAKEVPPVTMTGKGATSELKTLPGGAPIECTANTFEAKAGEAKETHVTLGTIDIHFTTCSAVVAGSKLSCASETEAGVKDEKGVILVQGDLHVVSLETSAKKLVAGILILLLKQVKLNCSGVKIIVEGTAIGEVEKASATADVTEVGVNFVAIPSLLKCDEKDALCIKLIKEFACAKSGSLCANVTGTLENADQIAKDTVTIKPMVQFDF